MKEKARYQTPRSPYQPKKLELYERVPERIPGRSPYDAGAVRWVIRKINKK